MTADLSALIARLEAAEVGSAELDYLIDEAFSEWKNIGGGWAAHKVTGARRNNHFDYPDSVTTSLDAALALAERVLPEVFWEMSCRSIINGQKQYGITLWPADLEAGMDGAHGHAPSTAMALCIAILRAKQGEGAA